MKLNGSKAILLVLALSLALGGCLGGKKAPMKVSYYTLEYEAVHAADEPIDKAIRVKRFSVAPNYNSTKIIYRDGPYKRSEYNYHRWRVNPGDQVTYFLRRDFRESGLFAIVADETTRVLPDYVLEGSVDEFYELDGAEGWEAVLEITTTLLRAGEMDSTRQVVFQKSYRNSQPCAAKTPESLAQAMSQALGQTSRQLGADIREALADKKK